MQSKSQIDIISMTGRYEMKLKTLKLLNETNVVNYVFIYFL